MGLIRIKKKLARNSIFLFGLVNGLFTKSKLDTRDSSLTFQYFVKDCHTFFGYHDKTPFDRNNSKLLAIVCPISIGKKQEGIIRVGYFDLLEERDNNNFIQIGDSNTWCWQQGCRLQWFPHIQNSIIYNKATDIGYGSVVQDITNGSIVSEFKFPIYDISATEMLALTINFSRLGRLNPGYGYSSFPDETLGDSCPEYDGVWIVDLKTARKRLLISLNRLGKDIKKSNNHHVVSVLFNQAGQRTSFLHFYQINERYYTRLYCVNLVDERLVEVDSNVTHYTWYTNDKLLYFKKDKKRGDGYWVYDFDNGTTHRYAPGILIVDGHPTRLADYDAIITDTYPSKFTRQQRLLMFHENTGKVNVLYSRYVPMAFRDFYRCDFHPRFSTDSKFVCIDDPSTGVRRLKVFNVNQLNRYV